MKVRELIKQADLADSSGIIVTPDHVIYGSITKKQKREYLERCQAVIVIELSKISKKELSHETKNRH